MPRSPSWTWTARRTRARSPYLTFVHFDDIGFVRIVTCEADHQGLIKRRERLKANLRKIGLEINR